MISILVPIYNAEQYIKRCIDSILAQTYMDFELILLDDGSKDNSGTICDEYAAKDSRVKVIHTSNNGVGIARNRLIDAADGDYLCFVDSDDYIERDMLEVLYHNIIQYGADISLCGIRMIFPKIVKSSNNDPSEQRLLNKKEAVCELIDNWKITCSTWSKLYKAELFEGIRYAEIAAFEDMLTTYKLFQKSESIVYDGRLLYNYVNTPDSLMRIKFNPHHFAELEALKMMTENIGAAYPDLIPKLKINELKTKVYICNRIISESPEMSQLYNDLAAEIRDSHKELMRSEYVGTKVKIMVAIMKTSDRLYKACVKTVKYIVNGRRRHA